MAPQPAKPAETTTDTTTTEAVKKEAVRRDYGIYQELTLDLGDPGSLVTQLQRTAVDGKVTVLARAGIGTGINPRKGLEAVAQDVELSGDYEVAALQAFNSFPNVSTQQARVVKIG